MAMESVSRTDSIAEKGGIVSNKHSDRRKFYLTYLILFLFLYYICFQIFFARNGKSYIWSVDGMETQYNKFVYFGLLVKNSIRTHSIPLWDMAIGYGSDIRTFLGDCLFDPFVWLFAVTPSAVSEYLFDLIVMLKIGLSGIAFATWCRSRGHQNYAVLLGALIYAFSGTVMIGFKQEAFLNIFYIFPFLMIGVDRIWEHRSGKLFIFMLVWCFCNSYYFSLMAVIFLLAHALIRFLTGQKRSLREFGYLIARFMASGTIAFLIAIGLILPDVMVILQTDRLSFKRVIPTFYEHWFNGNVLAGIIGTYDMGTDCIVGICSVALVLLILMLVGVKKQVRVKLEVLALTACLFIPYVGHVLNGFNYATNRWIWAWLLAVTYATVLVLEGLESLRLIHYGLTAAVLLAYALVVKEYYHIWSADFKWPLLIAAVFLAMLILTRAASQKRARQVLCLLCLIVSLWTSACYYLTWRGDRYIYQEQNAGTALGAAVSDSKSMLLGMPDLKQTRYETFLPRLRNSSMITGTNGYDYYNSYYNNDIDKYHSQLGVMTPYFATAYLNLNSRSVLEHLNATKYYIAEKGKEGWIPYGYDKLVKTRENMSLYTTDAKVSMIHSSTKAISEADYLKMDLDEREQALAQAVVLSDSSQTPKSDVKLYDTKVPYEIGQKDSGLEVQGNQFSVSKDKQAVTLNFHREIPADGELLVELDNLQNVGDTLASYDIHMQAYHGNQIVGDSLLSAATYHSHMYGNKHNWLANLGYINVPVDRLKITFRNAGKYSVDQLKIVHRSKDTLDALIHTIDYNATDLSIGNNRISAEIEQKEDGYTMLSVPYSKGWKAQIDGHPAETLKVDNAFMAVSMPAGTHHLSLSYQPPYVKEGLAFTGALLILILIVNAGLGRRKRANEKNINHGSVL